MKRTQEENIEQLAKLAQVDFVWKMALTAALVVGGYYSYLYLREKSEEFKLKAEEIETKLAKLPLVGRAFKES